MLYAALRHGLSFKIGGGKVVTLCPPLTIGDDDFVLAWTLLEKALGDA